MVRRLAENGIFHKKERFFFEDDTEREVLEEARNFFGDAYTLFTKGLNRVIRITKKRYSPQRFNQIKVGRLSISVDEWEKIQEYSSRYKNGEKYDSEAIIELEL